MEHNQCTIVPPLIIKATYVSNFMTILDFFHESLKKPVVMERLFWRLGTHFDQILTEGFLDNQ